MNTNTLPNYDASDNPTGCCPRFNPEGWNDQTLHFEEKPFVRVETRSIFHIPINMGSVFPRTFAHIEAADARRNDDFVVLSFEVSPWKAEHLFSVTKPVPEYEMVALSGDFLTKVFEGPFRKVSQWEKAMKDHAEGKGRRLKKTYFFYTTCPKCAKTYGKNYVVAVSEVE